MNVGGGGTPVEAWGGGTCLQTSVLVFVGGRGGSDPPEAFASDAGIRNIRF